MLDAAQRLIQEKGDAFTTQELVKEAGVALQTFYRYFASKDELLLALIADAMTDACTRWAEAGRELPDPVARLRFYITAVIDVLDSESWRRWHCPVRGVNALAAAPHLPRRTRRGRKAVRRTVAR